MSKRKPPNKERVNAYCKKRRAQKKADGICNYCNEKAAPNRRSCAFHQAKYAEEDRLRRELFRRAGICYVKGCYEREFRAHFCKTHYAKERESSRKRDYAPGQRRYYRNKKERGLCTKCSSPPIPGLTLCDKHRLERKRWQVSAESRDRYRVKRIEKGFCSYCNNLVEEGKKTCLYHLLKYRRLAREDRARATREGICYTSGCPEKRFKGGLCTFHYPIYIQYRIDRRKRRKANGLCTVCGKPHLYTDRYRTCPKCRKHRQVIFGTEPSTYEWRMDRRMFKSYLNEAPKELRKNEEAMEWIKNHRDLFIDEGDSAMSKALPLFENFDFERMDGNKRKATQEWADE